jgi:predicted PurR-regulated permease PerM
MSDKLRGGKIVEFIPMLKDSTRRFVAEQIDSFVRILVSFYQRQILICIIEGILYGFGFWVVGLPYGFIIGFLLGCLNLIPFFGSLVCIPLAVIMAYFGADGSGLRVVLVLVVWIVGQVLDGYYITPKIQGDKTGLGYAGVIFSFLFWPIVLGPMLGLLLAIPLSACCVVLWRGFCEFTKHKKVF